MASGEYLEVYFTFSWAQEEIGLDTYIFKNKLDINRVKDMM